MKYVLIIPLLLCLSLVFSQNASEELNTIFTDLESYNNQLNPQDSLRKGHHLKGSFSKVDKEHKERVKLDYEQFISRLNSVRNEDLSHQERISNRLMRYKLENTLSDIRFNMYLIPLNAEGGFYFYVNNSLLDRLPFRSIKDYQDYLHWLPGYVGWMEDHISFMKQGIQEGIVAPKIVIENNISLVQSWLAKPLAENVFYKPIANMPENLDKLEADNIRDRAESVLKEQVIPVYQKLDSFLRTEYLDASPEMPGINNLPGGKEYYEDRIRHFTTLDISPDSVHQLGLQEVARIKGLMVEIIEELEFEGSFDDFYAFLRTDEQFYPKTGQELLNKAAWLSKKAEGQLPKLFRELYTLPFTVEPVPDAIAPTYTAGRYAGGSWDQQKAGAYWVNTYHLESRTLYTLPALTLHEAVPGHHLQISLSQELTGIPSFRNSFYTSAFGEGWGLYSEYLGEEMGMYMTPYERFGRYTYEMWRACRLVVDTGIHYKGWSRDRALDYMKSTTALSLHEITTEIDRYIGWPGQAVSYKIGELKIKALRKEAEEQLGTKFDIREFHYHILKNGSVTLPILQQEIAMYISSAKEN